MDPQRWREIRALFNELVELDPARRAERLAALGAGDPQLREAVESLLAADADSSGGLGGAALPPRAGRSAAPPDPLGLAGRRLSHFCVLEPLEAGGMGVVYRAEDTRLGRAVALKFLLPHHTLDPAATQRFLQEARTAGALDHPNLCTIYEVGESVKILDFGIAKARELELTSSGRRLGTVSYMAPEQVRGETVDARADLWALGVVLYEMLTGHRPFPGEHETAIAHAIVSAEPEPPSNLHPELPPAVEALVLTALQKEPARRHLGAPELLEDLSAIPLAGAPAPRRGWRSRGRRARRARTGWLVLAGAALALAGGLATRPLRDAGTGGMEAERSVAVLPFTNLSQDPDNEYFSDGITEEILTSLAGVGDLRVISRTSAMRYKGSDKPLRQIASELGVAHVLEGSVQRAGDQVRINVQLIDAGTDRQLWAQRYDRPLQDVFAVQSEIAHQIAVALRVRLSAGERARIERRPTTSLQAHDLVLRARNLMQLPDPQTNEAALDLTGEALTLDPTYADAFVARSGALLDSFWRRGEAARLDSAVVAARHAISLDPGFAPAYAALGTALNIRGDREAALEAQRRAVALNPNLSGGLANLYEYDYGRLDEAARLWERALASDPTNALTLYSAGRTYQHLGMTERARALFDRARKVQPGFPWIQLHFSLTYIIEGRPQEARVEIQRMLAAERAHPDALLWAGQIAAALGDLAAARRYIERGFPEARIVWWKEQTGITLAWILQQSGDAERARQVLQEASDRFEARRRGQPWRPEDHVESARIRIVAGDREGAIRALQVAVQSGWRLYNADPNDAILGSLQGDPRYDRLMAEMKADIARMRERVERAGW